MIKYSFPSSPQVAICRSEEEHNTVFGPGISENSIRKELGFNIRGVY